MIRTSKILSMIIYLRNAIFQVLVNSQVTKVLIENETKTATGIEYVDISGERHTISANKEVVISAGAVNSPQLLLLSGVGPKANLEEVGIDVVVDLPGVGQNLQNHVAASVGFFIDDDDKNIFTNEALDEFVQNRTGNLASTGVTQTTIFMTSKYATDGVPDLQVKASQTWRQYKANILYN